jgi:hypothetical protein
MLVRVFYLLAFFFADFFPNRHRFTKPKDIVQPT